LRLAPQLLVSEDEIVEAVAILAGVLDGHAHPEPTIEEEA
jgi:hypothetical protein